MNIEEQREKALQLCRDLDITVLPYANAWWLLGQGISRVVGELAGLSYSHLHRTQAVPR